MDVPRLAAYLVMFVGGGALTLGLRWFIVWAIRAGAQPLVPEHLKEVEVLKVERDEARAGVEHWKAMYEAEHRKREEVFSFIVDVQKERDVWKELYFAAGLGHSAAQEILMRKCQHYARLAKREVDPQLVAGVKNYAELHGQAKERHERERIGDSEKAPTESEGVAIADPNA